MLHEASRSSQQKRRRTIAALALAAALLAPLAAALRTAPAAAQDSPAPTRVAPATAEATAEPTAEATAEAPATGAADATAAEIVDDEGGPVVITGEVAYTDPFFTMGVASPMVILEDQAGFVDRNERFIMPPASQTIGQITSDFYESPFTYSLALPIEPQGTLRDVDQDGDPESGVMIFAVAYWTNTWGDPFLEERDLSGGGWSTAYASTRVSEEWETQREIVGGTFVVYALDDQQGFPSGFGPDGLLFTEDDPIVTLPQGYTLVNMDSDPFVFSRPAEAVVDLIEPEGVALDDFSDLTYAEAFDGLLEKLRNEYAFTEYKNIDWDALGAEFRPRFEEADADNDRAAYTDALREFSWRIPDGHVHGPGPGMGFQEAAGGGLGIAIADVEDGRVLVSYLTPNGPAEDAGIELGAEIIALDGTPIGEAVENAVSWFGPYSTEHVERLDKLRFAVRFPLETEVEVTWRNPKGDEQTETIEAAAEYISFDMTALRSDSDMLDLPVEFSVVPGTDYVIASITSFADNAQLAIQLWERLITTLNNNGVPGVIIDMRNNSGGSGFLADQMAAYFFDEPLEVGQSALYDKSLDEFTTDPRNVDRLYLPDESLRYRGNVAVLVGPNCASACEFFSYVMTLEDRAAIVGQFPTAGLGGGVADALMPGGIFFRMTIARELDMDGEIHIEGKGVAPTVEVPVNEETLFGGGDPVLQAAVEWLDDQR